ncbi:MAG: S41 family peptidase [Bacteroidetes bacterium]|nr:S41 family peptidase [Bacteroidota bacterium]
MLASILCIAIAYSAGAQPRLTAKERNAVIDSLVAKLGRIYVYEDVAQKMGDVLRLHRSRGDYDTVSDRAVFARMLTSELRAISKDGHLGVDYSAAGVKDESPGSPSEEVVMQFRNTWARSNFNFKKVEVMEGNVGLLELNTFFPAEWIKELAQSAMSFLGNTDAVIIDLRNNHGFAPDGVLLMESYFFNDAVHLSDAYDRDGGTMRQTWTMPVVAGRRLGEVDVYILVGRNTFSAPEDFTYNMQAMGRAKVVGEVTGGGAHGTRPFKVGEYFTASIPFSYSVSTVTHTDWEGRGVQPDVVVPADKALLTAQVMAIRALVKRIAGQADRVAELEKIIRQKEGELAAMR